MLNNPTTLETSTSPTRLLPPYIKRHGHKRSSAISGDFDINNAMSIFTTNTIPLSRSVPTDDISPIHLYTNDDKTPPLRQLPLIYHSNQQQQQQQSPMIFIENSSSTSSSSCFNYDSPLKSTSSPHTLNSPLGNLKKTRFFMTDETKFDKFSDIPNALIDLDDIITKQNVIRHKRTESAPAEFNGFNINSNMERFLTSPVRNEIVVEENEEESDDNESISSHLLSKVKPQNNMFDNAASESSSINSVLTSGNNQNSSTHSLQSITQFQQFQQQQQQQQSQDKSPSVSSLRGKGARYQNYYSNQQKVGSVRPTGLKKSIDFKPMSRSSSKSPSRHSLGFNFESIPYDMPENLLSDYYNEKPKLNPPSRSSSPLKHELVNQHKHERSKSLQSSPEKSHTRHNTAEGKVKNKPISKSKSHKKSNSLFNSISKIHLRINSLSSSSTSSVNKNELFPLRRDHHKSSSIILKTTDEDLIHYQQKSTATAASSPLHDNTLTTSFFDTTLTNLGEPGPMIFNPINNNNNDDDDDEEIFKMQEEEEEKFDNNFQTAKAVVKEEDKKVKHRWWFRRSTHK